MKRIYLILGLILGLAIGVNAQNIKLTYEGKEFKDTLKIGLTEVSDNPLFAFIHFTNTTESPIDIKLHLRKTLIAQAVNPEEPNDIQMCFDKVCIADTVSPSSITLNPGEEYTGFDLVYFYDNFESTSLARINMLNPESDEVIRTFVVSFMDSGKVSLPSISKLSTAKLDVYPNPVQNMASINYYLPKEYSNGQIVIRNMVGSVVKTENIKGGVSGKYQFNSTELTSGVYFYSIVVNGKSLSTKKMIVKH